MSVTSKVAMLIGALPVLLAGSPLGTAADVRVVDEGCIRHRVLACLKAEGTQQKRSYALEADDAARKRECAPGWTRFEMGGGRTHNQCERSYDKNNWSDLPSLTNPNGMTGPSCEFDARYGAGAEKCYQALSVPTTAEFKALADELKKTNEQLNTNFVQALDRAFKCAKCENR